MKPRNRVVKFGAHYLAKVRRGFWPFTWWQTLKVWFGEPGSARGYPQIFGSVEEARAALEALRDAKPSKPKPQIVAEF